MKVEHKGSIIKVHSSGMVESDKGFKYPYNKAEIGDIMLDVDGDRMIVTKKEYREKWAKEVTKAKKAEEAKKEEVK